MAIRQNMQLEELSYEYELFRANQLLTHEQINKFIRYFEDQDRLTRTCLIGVGLVCGLSARFRNNSLSVSQGCAVTTDGDLLKHEATDYKFFRPYTNRTQGKADPIYDPFFPPAQEGQVALWEMMVSNEVEVGTPPEPLTNFKAASGKDVDDMVALLYLEYYLREPDDCTAIDCDQLGQLQHARIKVLLIAPADMDKVINSEPTEIIADHIYKSYYEAYESYFELPEITAQRLPINSINSASLAALGNGYAKIIRSGATELINAIEKLYNTFQFILDPKKYFKISTIKSKLTAHLNSTTKIYQQQYLYDFYKDLIDAYNEIRNTIYNAIYICCPDKYAFPKHIMLGIVNADLGPKPPKYRHGFYPSPAVTKNRAYLSVAKSMFNRLNEMTQGFFLPESALPIKVTPSADRPKTMEYRAIPFYYNNVSQLINNWSYYRTMRGTQTRILSYYSDQYAADNATKNPLNHSLENFDLFRVEGHLGKKMQTVMKDILTIRNNQSLPFDVVAVRMDHETGMSINIEDFSCQFEDLNAVLNAWIVEQDCLYAKTVDFFSSFDNTGNNLKGKRKRGFRINTNYSGENELRLLDTKPSGLVINTVRKNESSAHQAVYQSRPIQNYQQFFQVDDTVNTNLNQTQGTIGSVFMEASKNNQFWLGDAFIGLLLEWGLNDAVISALNADVREIVFNIPVRLIARVNDVTRNKPFEIKDLGDAVLDNYEAAIENLCEEAEASLAKASSIFAKSTYQARGYEAAYKNALVELNENCCAADKLRALIAEIKSRKQKIIDSLSFARYAQNHSGLEHKAGVPAGGTFVLLYASTGSTQTPATRVPPNYSFDSGRNAQKGGDLEKNKRYVRSAQDFFEMDEDSFLLTIVDGEQNYDPYESIQQYLQYRGVDTQGISGKTKLKNLLFRAKEFAELLELERNDRVNQEMVVADFSLPYLCCSDCPPMVFMIPNPKFELALPADETCSNAQVLPFKREPADGQVGAEGFEETLAEKNGTAYFDPSKVKPTDYGKTISFTINGQLTDCSIIVWKHPVATANFRIVRETKELLEVIFGLQSDDESGKEYQYEWNFGEGKPGETRTSTDSFVHTYIKSAFANEQTIKVSMRAINHTCSSEVQILDIPLKGEVEEPDDTCSALMDKELSAAQQQLQSLMKKADDPELIKCIEELLAQYELAASYRKTPENSGLLRSLLAKLAELVQALLSGKVGANYPQESSAVLRILLQLPLQITRCLDNMEAAQNRLLAQFYNQFFKLFGADDQIMYATLDSQKVLSNYIQAYLKDTGNKDAAFNKALQAVIKLLSSLK